MIIIIIITMLVFFCFVLFLFENCDTPLVEVCFLFVPDCENLCLRAIVTLITCVYLYVLVCAAGGGAVKIESHKINFREKAQSKVGSIENVSHTPGGGNIKVRLPCKKSVYWVYVCFYISISLFHCLLWVKFRWAILDTRAPPSTAFILTNDSKCILQANKCWNMISLD